MRRSSLRDAITRHLSRAEGFYVQIVHTSHDSTAQRNPCRVRRVLRVSCPCATHSCRMCGGINLPSIAVKGDIFLDIAHELTFRYTPSGTW